MPEQNLFHIYLTIILEYISMKKRATGEMHIV